MVKAARRDAELLARAAGMRAHGSLCMIKFHPPDRRKRDLDNMFSALKPTLDGICDHLGIDDSTLEFVLQRGPVISGGAVHISFSPNRLKSAENP